MRLPWSRCIVFWGCCFHFGIWLRPKQAASINVGRFLREARVTSELLGQTLVEDTEWHFAPWCPTVSLVPTATGAHCVAVDDGSNRRARIYDRNTNNWLSGGNKSQTPTWQGEDKRATLSAIAWIPPLCHLHPRPAHCESTIEERKQTVACETTLRIW